MKFHRILFTPVRWFYKGVQFLLTPTAVVAILGLGGADLYLENKGLPPGGVEWVQAWLVRHAGVCAEIEEVRAGLFRGIVAENVTVWDGSRPGSPLLEAETIQLQLDWHQLAMGRFRLRAVRGEGLGLYLPLDRRDPDSMLKLPLIRLSGNARIRADNVELSSLTGDVAGIKVQLRGTFSETDLFFQRLRERWEADRQDPFGPQPFFGWEALTGLQGDVLQASLRTLIQSVAKNGVPQSDGALDARFTLPLTQPRNGRIWGTLSLADISLHSVDVRKIRTRFALYDRKLKLEQAFLQVIGDQMAAGEVECDLVRHRLHGSARGTLNPEVLFRLLGKPVPRLLAETRVGSPVNFSVTLRPSPWTLENLDADVHGRVSGLWYGDWAVGEAETTVAFRPGQPRSAELRLSDVRFRGFTARRLTASGTFELTNVQISHLDVSVDDAHREEVTGSATIYPGDGAFSAELQGRLRPAGLLALWPEAPAGLRQVAAEPQFDQGLPSLTCRIERSPFAPAAWNGTLSVTAQDWRFRKLLVGKSETEARFVPGRVDLTQRATFGPEGKQSFDGSMVLYPERRTWQGSGKMNIWLDRLLQDLLPGSPGYIFSRITQQGEPAAVDVRVDESPLAPENWTGHGHAIVRDASYENLRFTSAEGDIEFAPGLLAFRGINAQTVANELLQGEIAIGLTAGTVQLAGTVVGDPRLAQVFVAAGTCRDNFLRVWQDLTWDAASPPTTTIESFKFFSAANDPYWSLQMKAHLTGRNGAWKGTPAALLEVDGELDLPRRASFRNARVCVGDGEASGGVELSFDGIPACHFHLHNSGDPRQLVRVLNPAWESYFQNLQFSDKSQVECEGSFFFAADARTRLWGTLDTPMFQRRRLRVEDLSAKWRWDGTVLGWSPAAARVYGGKLLTTGTYDFATDSGQILVSGEEADLAQLLEALGAGGKGTRADGKLSATCRLELLRFTPTAPLQINGTGRIWLTHGDLWGLPVLGKLSDLIGLGGIGKISRLDAELTFAGDHVVVPDFHTDGTLLALKGAGDYRWDTQKLEFKVRGEALKTTRVLPMLLKPLFWFFEADLTGTVSEPRWSLARGLKDVFND